MTFISRILGFIRDMVAAILFGATPAYEAFIASFRISNYLRSLFAEGAFSQAFVPLLTEYRLKHGHKEAKDFAGKVGGTLASALIVVTIIVIIFSSGAVFVFASGFSADDTNRFELASSFLKVTFPYLFFISMTAFCAALLNTSKIFGPSAFAPALLNIVMILSALFLSKYFEVPVWSLAIGIFIAGIVQFLFVLIFVLKHDLLGKFKIAWYDPGVRKLLKIIAPALFGVSIYQINVLIITHIASYLPKGSFVWIYQAERIAELPAGIIGVAFYTVMLPSLSKSAVSQNKEQFTRALHWACKGILLVSIPASVGLIILSRPILTTLYCYGKFTTYDVEMTRLSVIVFAFGIPAAMLSRVFSSAFYAQKDLKTPVKIGVVTIVVNLICNAFFVQRYGHMGLTLSITIAAYVQVILMWLILKKGEMYQAKSYGQSFLKKLIIPNIVVLSWCTVFAINDGFVWHQLSGWNRTLHLSWLLLGAAFLYFLSLRMVGFRYRDIKEPEHEEEKLG